MVALKANEIEGFLKRNAAGQSPQYPVVLVYGPDIGLVNERAKAIAEKATEDPDDPFQLIRIDWDVIASDPRRLVDEATTVGLFGGRRTVWVKPSGRNFAAGVEALLAIPDLTDTVVVIEGGDLAKSAPLRTLCEKSRNALAIPCYADSERDLAAVVEDMFRQEGFVLSRDVRQAIVASVGGDRLATRGELAKLLLYVHGRNEVTLDDVEAVLADVSSLAMDAIVDAAFSGNPAAVENNFHRLVAEGTHASVILGAALRHALSLLQARLDIEEGRPASAVLENWRGLHFKRKAQVERQLSRWSADGLKTAIRNLQSSLLETRRFSVLSDDIGGRTLLSLAIRRG